MEHILKGEGLKMVIVKADKALGYMRNEFLRYIKVKNADRQKIEHTQRNLETIENLISSTILYIEAVEAEMIRISSKSLEYKLQAKDFHQKWLAEIEQHTEFSEMFSEILKKRKNGRIQ